MENPQIITTEQECPSKTMIDFMIPQAVPDEERKLYEKLRLYKAQIPQDLPKFLNFCWNTLAIRDFPLIAKVFVKLESAGVVNKISEINLETKTKPSTEGSNGGGGKKQQVEEKTSEVLVDAYEQEMLPINEWMDIVRRTEILDLTCEEKEIVQFIKVHKNVPQIFSHFHGYCFNYLKIEDKKLIVKIWRHFRVAAIERAIKTKSMSQNEKQELEKLRDLLSKHAAFNLKKTEGKDIQPAGPSKKKDSPVVSAGHQQQVAKKILEVAKKEKPDQDKFHSISLELAENIMKLINISLENAHTHITKNMENEPVKM